MHETPAMLTRELFRRAVKYLDGRVDDRDWERRYYDLVDAHRGRAYHSWRHVGHKLGWTYRLFLAGKGIQGWGLKVLTLADFYHDAIYDTQPHEEMSNEEASADLARSALGDLGVESKAIEEIARQILLTQHHAVAEDDQLGQIMVDSDLAILASSEEEYRAYATGIREEYSWVEDAAYAEGRSKVLRSFLDRERLFFSLLLNEQQAKKNLRSEIESFTN